MSYLLVFLGSGIGGLLRFLVYKLQGMLSLSFPLATLTCNFIGSVAIIFVFYFIKEEDLKVFLATGLLGGFTTYSTAVLDVAKTPQSILYILANLVIVGFCLVLFKFFS